MKEILLSHISNMGDYISSGGIVMIPLLIISIIMWSFIIERLLFFKRLYQDISNREEIIKYARKEKISDIESHGIISIFIREFLERKTGRKKLDQSILDEIALDVFSCLDEYIPVIKILATIAPLLGLLGTVTGMIKTFDVISVFGTGNAKLMASGISEALITTQTGLIIAIPGIYMGRFLERRSENLKQRIRSITMYIKRHI